MFCQQDIRESPAVFRSTKRVDTYVVRAWLLCKLSGEEVVGAVQATTLARHARSFHLSGNTWSG